MKKKPRQVHVVVGVDVDSFTNIRVQMFFGWRDAIVRYEIIVLETLCFDLSVNHPYEPLLDILGELKGNQLYSGINQLVYSLFPVVSESVVQSAWGFANDRYVMVTMGK